MQLPIPSGAVTRTQTPGGTRGKRLSNMAMWHVVTSYGNVVLGVFGEALLSTAQECARRVERQTGLPAYVNQVRGNRPVLGSVSK